MPIPLSALENPKLKAWTVTRTYVEKAYQPVYAETQEEALAKARKEAPHAISEEAAYGSSRDAYLTKVEVARNTDPFWREADEEQCGDAQR